MALWLVRHGETEWSLSGRHTGQTDLPLSEEGELQAAAIGTMLGRRGFDHVRSSPRARALETGRLAGFGDRIDVDEALVEVDYGEYEGLTTLQIRARRPGWELFRDGSPGGESPSEVERRVERLLADLAELDGNVLLFGHGHCFRALAARFLRLPLELAAQLRVDAGSISVLAVERDGPTMVLWNRRVAPRPVLVADIAVHLAEVTE